MKKFIYVAVMALTLGFFSNCTPRASVGNEPKLDEQNSTLNGVFYDNTVYKCWEFTWSYVEKENGAVVEQDHGVDYEWTTELMARYHKALWDYDHNMSASAYGQSWSISGTCTLVENTNKNESSCYSDVD